jgi:hypothetical protein
MASRGFWRHPSSKGEYLGWRRRRTNEYGIKVAQVEQQTAPSLGRVVYFPGLSHAEADHAAKALIERGEIASDDLVIGLSAAPLGPPDIHKLPCTTAEYIAWLDAQPEPNQNETRRNAT